jgi:hypothetical protein
MKSELQQELYEKYPEIFKQKDLPKQQTCMCWGITCGNGWYVLIDELCANIKNRIENVRRNYPDVEILCEATQVKEKYGGLRFYTYGGDEYINGLISMAESMSYNICSECGDKSTPQSERGWIYTLCDKCKEK